VLPHLLSPALVALLQVILIDLVLAGDNAVFIGMSAARVPPDQRRKVIFWGLAAAVVIRVILAMLTATLMAIIGLVFAGGILLLWVSWRLYREFNQTSEEEAGAFALRGKVHPETAHLSTQGIRKAVMQIVVADLSMSLDNVLGVAGAARDHVWVLAIGLMLSIGLMGIAAAMVANLLQRHPWINYAGLIIIVYVALRMIWDGGADIFLSVLWRSI